MNSLRSIPQAAGYPILGVLPKLFSGPFEFCMKTAKKHEGAVALKIGPTKVYLITHPDYVEQIFITNNKNYYKGPIMDGIRFALGNGLFTSNGDFWRRQRRLMQPAFHKQTIANMNDTMNQISAQHFENWEAKIVAKEPLELVQDLIFLNTKIIMRSLFGKNIDQTLINTMIKATDGIFEGMQRHLWMFFIPNNLPLPGRASYQKAIKTLDQTVIEVIRLRRQQIKQTPNLLTDLLDMFLNIQDQELGEGMTDQQIRDEIFTIFIAGYESTGIALTWICYLIAQHPAVQKKLQDEVDRVLGKRPATFQDFSKLTYTKQVIDEGLRIYPPFPMFFRTSIAEDAIGPYRIPPQVNIIASPYGTHRMPEIWPNPEQFDPNRFAPENLTPLQEKAYYPFGKGRRFCIGQDFVLAESFLVISAIAQKYHLTLAPNSKSDLSYAMTLRPKYGMPMLIKKRPD